MIFYFRNATFEIKNFSRAMNYGVSSNSSPTSTKIDVETDIKNFDLVEKLFMDQFQPAFNYTFNIELEPKGLLHECRFSEYTLTDTKIFFQIVANYYDPYYINLKKQRKLKLKQLEK